MDAFAPMSVANVSQLTDQLWIGGDLATSDTGEVTALALAQLDEIEAVGITDILDLRLEWNDEKWVEARKPHLRYHWLGVDDAGQRMPDEWFAAGTKLVLDRITAGARVLIHCHQGVNRGPSMAFAVLLCQGHEPIDALELIRRADRPHASPTRRTQSTGGCAPNEPTRRHVSRPVTRSRLGGGTSSRRLPMAPASESSEICDQIIVETPGPTTATPTWSGSRSNAQAG